MKNEEKIIATLKKIGNYMFYKCLADNTFGNGANSQRANHVCRDSKQISILKYSKCFCKTCKTNKLRDTAFIDYEISENIVRTTETN